MRAYIQLLLVMQTLFVSFSLYSVSDVPHKTVCLNMIVKDESKVIERCLTSVLPIIDSWVIVDTGSTDGTQNIIKKFMKEHGVPGTLYERPWVNFEHNRNEALQLAQNKADYVFFIDADEYLVYEPDFKLPNLDKDYYYVTLTSGGTKFGKVQLLNNHQDWKWVGVVHEVIALPASRTVATLDKVVNIYTKDGVRSRDPKIYEKDAAILEAALEKEPNNSRYVFYLAQSYRDAGNYPKALENYEKRVKMGEWDQEVFYAMLAVAYLQEQMKMAPEVVLDSYKKSFIYRPSRAEPIYHLANYYRNQNNFEKGYQTAKLGLTLPISKDVLFVNQWMHDIGIPLEYSISAYWIGKYEESHQASLDLLKREDLSPEVRTCVEQNLGFAKAKLLEQLLVNPVTAVTP
ncbi:MAG: glycosyltransferase family 2 protein [Parachlamydiaceae bacterium]|nr:glycosyltransferase family 2 protein [Parachlamydiaceae bacterium]